MESRQTATADSTPTPAPYVRSTPAVTATPKAPVAAASTPAPAQAPVAISTPTPTQTASAPAPTPQAPITNRVLEAPKVDTPPSVPTPSVSAGSGHQTNGSSANDAEVESLKEVVDRLKRDNESLKEEVAERDTLIRGLELKLEKVKVRFFFLSLPCGFLGELILISAFRLYRALSCRSVGG